MKKRLIKLISYSILILFILNIAFSCFAKEKPVKKISGKKTQTAEEKSETKREEGTEETKELTKEEILTRLKSILQYHPDILVSIPGLTGKTDDNGVTSYEYNTAPLDTLDRETLFGLLRNANSQVSWKNFERTQRQLKALKQVDDFNRTQRMLRQQRQATQQRSTQTHSIPKIPKTYTPPKVPKVPKTYKPPKRY